MKVFFDNYEHKASAFVKKYHTTNFYVSYNY